MRSISHELETLIQQHLPQLKAIPGSEWTHKSSPTKWSRKEIMGHLIDSAYCNIRRFIVAQYEETPTIVYNQDKWVAITGYQHWDTHDLVDLWYLLNKQVCAILNNTSPEMARRICRTQDQHTIEWLAIDYIKHLRHHLHQVLQLEPVAYP